MWEPLFRPNVASGNSGTIRELVPGTAFLRPLGNHFGNHFPRRHTQAHAITEGIRKRPVDAGYTEVTPRKSDPMNVDRIAEAAVRTTAALAGHLPRSGAWSTRRLGAAMYVRDGQRHTRCGAAIAWSPRHGRLRTEAPYYGPRDSIATSGNVASDARHRRPPPRFRGRAGGLSVRRTPQFRVLGRGNFLDVPRASAIVTSRN